MADSIPPLQPGELFAARYEIVRFLGRGGMGAVYEAKDRELANSAVALKIIHSNLADDEQLFSRFRNEVLLARSLSHQGIAKTFDLGRGPDGTAFITMEYVDGTSLKEELEKGALPLDRAIAVVREILSAIAHAHEKGVVHRDLKPGNVLINRQGSVRIVDFGTARLLSGGAELTNTGEVIGTPAYMAPEQITGGAIDPRTDLYAVSIMAFEVVAGRRPFEADSLVGLAMKHVHEPLPSLAEANVKAPAWLDSALRKAAAKNPADRFSTANEFLAALEPKAPGQTPSSKSGPKVILSLAGLLMIAGGAFYFTRQNVKEETSRVRAAAATASLTSTSTSTSVSTTASTSTSLVTTSTLAPATTVTSTTEPLPTTTVTIPAVQSSLEAALFLRLPDSPSLRTAFRREELVTLRVIAELRRAADPNRHRYSFRIGGSSARIPAEVLAAGSDTDPRWRFKGSIAAEELARLERGEYTVEFLEGELVVGRERFEVE
jgi:serine/threonine protein kinase